MQRIYKSLKSKALSDMYVDNFDTWACTPACQPVHVFGWTFALLFYVQAYHAALRIVVGFWAESESPIR